MNLSFHATSTWTNGTWLEVCMPGWSIGFIAQGAHSQSDGLAFSLWSGTCLMQADGWHFGKCSAFLLPPPVSERCSLMPWQEAWKAAAWTPLFAWRVKVIEIPFLPRRRLGATPRRSAAAYFTLCWCGVMKPVCKETRGRSRSLGAVSSAANSPENTLYLEVKWKKGEGKKPHASLLISKE